MKQPHTYTTNTTNTTNTQSTLTLNPKFIFKQIFKEVMVTSMLTTNPCWSLGNHMFDGRHLEDAHVWWHNAYVMLRDSRPPNPIREEYYNLGSSDTHPVELRERICFTCFIANIRPPNQTCFQKLFDFTYTCAIIHKNTATNTQIHYTSIQLPTFMICYVDVNIVNEIYL